MYGWIWRHLPGPVPVKVVEALVLVLLAIAVLFLFVFPLIEPHVPFLDVTVN